MSKTSVPVKRPLRGAGNPNRPLVVSDVSSAPAGRRAARQYHGADRHDARAQPVSNSGKKYAPLLVYAAAAVLVLLPLLRPGYILTLDLVFAPHIALPGALTADYPLWLVLHILNLAIASQLIEKALLLAILVLAGWGAHRLVEKLTAGVPDWSEAASQWAAYFAGAFFMFNPFVYSRFMAGQFEVLLGYALLPFFVRALWRFGEQPGRRSAVLLAVWTTAVAIVSMYDVVPMALLAIVFAMLFVRRCWPDAAWRRAFIRSSGLSFVLVLILNSYWLAPLAIGSGQTAHIIGGFTPADVRAFATNGRGFGLVGNVLGLQGFWADSKNVFLVPQDVFGWWRVPVVLLWLVLGYGVWVGWRRRRDVTIGFMTIAAFGAVLAIGPAGTIVAPLNRWLMRDVPFFNGYREPQKFEVLIALAYVWFGALAVGAIVERLGAWKSVRQHAQSAAFVLCLLPVLTAPLMPWGFHGQLHAAEYPIEWDAINDRLSAECTGNCQVLFLPWHLYMRYGFAGRIVADPAPKFFASHIVASSDPELKGATPYSMSPVQTAVAGSILPKARSGGTHMGAALARYDIRFVLLAKEDDYRTYDFLNRQTDLQGVMDTPTLKLYEVKING